MKTWFVNFAFRNREDGSVTEDIEIKVFGKTLLEAHEKAEAEIRSRYGDDFFIWAVGISADDSIEF